MKFNVKTVLMRRQKNEYYVTMSVKMGFFTDKNLLYIQF